MKPKISIIIPIYNQEKYLEETILSAINQSYKDIEILLINDGSEDGSKDICEKYEKIDSRIKLINKENGGVSDARNVGLKLATGKYVMFLDASDLFQKDSCKNMFEVIERTNADYVTGNYIMMDENGKESEKPAFDMDKYQEFRLDKYDVEKSFFVMNSMACNKIYRMQFLRENDISFKVHTIAEDDFFTAICYMKAQVGFYTPEIMYLYRSVPNSRSKRCTLSFFEGINETYKKVYKEFAENQEINYYRYIYAKKNAYLLGQLVDSELMDDNQKVECLKKLQWYFDLGKNLKIVGIHETLKKIIDLIIEKDYNNAIIEMNEVKQHRKNLPVNLKIRSTFPTRENYIEMKKYDNEFINK